MTVSIDDPLAADAVAGLWADPPTLPAKWRYDERGSRLFDEITRLPEYYPTRRETAILRAHGADIVAATDATMMVEFGSGTSTKTRLLLQAFAERTVPPARGADGDVTAPDAAGRSLTYVPLDVSTEILESSASVLTLDYPVIEVAPMVADFTSPDLVLPPSAGPRVVVFLGGTIGNFDDAERVAFLHRLAGVLDPGDFFLLGADLIKDTGRLVAAYNDKTGVTADFNRNMIEVLRTGLDARGLYADDFDHIARWNPGQHRIEMWLRARRAVDAYFAALGRHWRLAPGTEVLTEISTKFDLSDLSAELADAGLDVVRTWTDDAGDFSLTLSGC